MVDYLWQFSAIGLHLPNALHRAQGNFVQPPDRGNIYMETRHAIISFSQGEKVKSGLIWCTHCVQILQNLAVPEQNGALQLLNSLIAMIANEAQVARQVSGDPVWLEVDKHLNNARIMIESGVSNEAEYHFTQALSQVNRISQKAMTHLMDEGLLS
jgi:hypothetical protein